MERKRRLNPFVLPSGTALRFGLLTFAVVGTTLATYGQLWRLSGEYDERADRCAGYAVPDFSGGLTLGPGGGPDEDCLAEVERRTAVWMLAGVGVLAITAVSLYRVSPLVKMRRDRLQPIHEEHAPGVPAALDGLADRAGVAPPSFVWNPLNAMDTAVTFGSGRKPVIAFGGGLVLRFYRDRSTFDAILLHELAHVRNRDVPLTYGALATWRAFVLVALVPVALGVIVPALRHMPGAYEGDDIAAMLLTAAGLAVLVFLMRSALLRTRELYADVRASQDRDALPALRGLLAQSSQHSSRLPTRLHPDAGERMTAVDDTGTLFRMGFGESLGAGVAAAIALVSIASLIASLLGEAQQTSLPANALTLATLLVGPFAAAVVVIGSWHMTISTEGRRPSTAMRVGLGLGLGICFASLLPLTRAENGDFLPGPTWLLLAVAVSPMLAAGVGLGARIWLARASTVSPRRALEAALVAGPVSFTLPLALHSVVWAAAVMLLALAAVLGALAGAAYRSRREPALPEAVLLPDGYERDDDTELIAPRAVERAVRERPAPDPTARQDQPQGGAARRSREAAYDVPRTEVLAAAGGLLLLAATFAPWYGGSNAYDSYEYTKQALLVAVVAPLLVVLMRAAAARLLTSRLGVVRAATSSLLGSRTPSVTAAVLALVVLGMVVLSPGDDPSSDSGASIGLYVGVGALALIIAASTAAMHRLGQVEAPPTRVRPLGELGRAHEIAAGEMVAAGAGFALVAFLFLNWAYDQPGWASYAWEIYPMLVPAGLALVLAVPRATSAWALSEIGFKMAVAAVAVTAVLVAAVGLTTGAPADAFGHLERYLPLPVALVAGAALVQVCRSRALLDVILVAASMSGIALILLTPEPSFDSGGTGMRLGALALVVTAIGGTLALVERRAWHRGTGVRPAWLAVLGVCLLLATTGTGVGASVMLEPEVPDWCDPCTTGRISLRATAPGYTGAVRMFAEHSWGGLVFEARLNYRATKGTFRPLVFSDVAAVRRFPLRRPPPRRIAILDHWSYAAEVRDMWLELNPPDDVIKHKMIGIIREFRTHARLVLWARLPRQARWTGPDRDP